MEIRHESEVRAPVAAVWDVYADVTHWPRWTASVTSAEFVVGDQLADGARVRIRQPKLPTTTWEVTELAPGRSWSWVSHSPGSRTTASHELTPRADGTTGVVQTIVHAGWGGKLVGRLLARRTRRYLAMEAAGLAAAMEHAR